MENSNAINQSIRNMIGGVDCVPPEVTVLNVAPRRIILGTSMRAEKIQNDGTIPRFEGIRLARIFIGFAIICLGVLNVKARNAEAFFDDTFVHEVRLIFEDPNWYSVLYESHLNDPEEPYFPASFQGDGESIAMIGVRFKGRGSTMGAQKGSVSNGWVPDQALKNVPNDSFKSQKM